MNMPSSSCHVLLVMYLSYKPKLSCQERGPFLGRNDENDAHHLPVLVLMPVSLARRGAKVKLWVAAHISNTKDGKPGHACWGSRDGSQRPYDGMTRFHYRPCPPPLQHIYHTPSSPRAAALALHCRPGVQQRSSLWPPPSISRWTVAIFGKASRMRARGLEKKARDRSNWDKRTPRSPVSSPIALASFYFIF